MPEQTKETAESNLRGQMVPLYAAYFVKNLIPLMTIPFLARVLGAETLGIWAFVQAFGVLIVTLLEFGFGLSMTRRVAQIRSSPEQLAKVLSGALGAQIFLGVVAVILTCCAQLTIPILRENPLLLWLAASAGALQGANLLWYFRGLEQMRLVASLEVLVRVLRTVGIFLFVREPQDVWVVPASDIAASFLSVLLALGLIYRTVPFRRPQANRAVRALTESWSLFVSRISANFFSAGNILILGMLVSSSTVAYFSSAEKISTALRHVFTPAFDALYPRISRYAAYSRTQAFEYVRKVLLRMEILAVVVGVAVFALAPVIIRILLGEEFLPAVTALRVFALFPPILVFNICLGSHFLLIIGYQQRVVLIGILVGILNLAMTGIAAALWPASAHYGAAGAVVLSQLVAAIALGVHTKRLQGSQTMQSAQGVQ